VTLANQAASCSDGNRTARERVAAVHVLLNLRDDSSCVACVEILVITLANSELRERVVQIRFDAMPPQAILLSLQLAVIKRNDRATRGGRMHERFDIASHTGNARHFGHLFPIHAKRRYAADV